MCGTTPASDVKVKLVDEDTGRRDDIMDEDRTAGSGDFLLTGEASDPILTSIDPMLQVWHRCGVDADKVRWMVQYNKGTVGLWCEIDIPAAKGACEYGAST